MPGKIDQLAEKILGSLATAEANRQKGNGPNAGNVVGAGGDNNRTSKWTSMQGMDAGTIAQAAAGNPAPLIQAKVNQIGTGISDFGGGIYNALSTRRANDVNVGHAAGSALRGGASLAGAIGGPVPEAIGKFAATIAESVDRLRDWNSVLHQSNIEFSKFSGGMASVVAQAEVQDIFRSARKGDARAASAQFQESGRAQLEDAMEPLENSFANMQNYITGTLDRFLVPFLKAVQPAVEGLESYVKTILSIFGSPIAANTKVDIDFNSVIMDWAKSQQKPQRKR